MSTLAVLSLALGIGGTTAVFSLIDGLLLRPLPSVGGTPGLVAMFGVHSRDPGRRQWMSHADYQEYAGRTDVMRDLAAFAGCDVSLTRRGQPAERVSGLAVSGSYFGALRLVPALGRLLGPADEHASVAVLGFPLWRRQFGGDPRVIDTTVTLNGKNVAIVGVAPPGFAGTDLRTRREIWVPLGAYSRIAAGLLTPFTGRHDRSQEWLDVLGRLAPGRSLFQAQAALQGTARGLAAAWPATNRERGVRLLPLAGAALGGAEARAAVRAFSARLMAAVAAVLAAAGLLGRSLLNLDAVPPGFDPAHVLAATVDLAPTGRHGAQVNAFYDAVLARLRRLPRVLDASMVSALPIMGADLEVTLDVEPIGGSAPAGSAGAAGAARPSAVSHVLVGSRYFSTVGMPVLRGRDFGAADSAAAPGVVILNQAAARQLWPGADALGRQVRLVQAAAPLTVVGVVADSTYASLKEDRRPILYLAHEQSGKFFIGELLAPQVTFLIHTAGAPWTVLGPLREEVRRSDPTLPVFQGATLADLLGATIGVEHQAAVLYGALALIAGGLAMLGLWSVLSLAITEQTREIGVRMACGATPADVWRRVVLASTWLSLAGVGAGAVAAVPAQRLLAGMLYHVGAFDPAIWGLSAGAVAGLAFAVSAVAGSRAARIDPVSAMKHE